MDSLQQSALRLVLNVAEIKELTKLRARVKELEMRLEQNHPVFRAQKDDLFYFLTNDDEYNSQTHYNPTEPFVFSFQGRCYKNGQEMFIFKLMHKAHCPDDIDLDQFWSDILNWSNSIFSSYTHPDGSSDPCVVTVLAHCLYRFKNDFFNLECYDDFARSFARGGRSISCNRSLW